MLWPTGLLCTPVAKSCESCLGILSFYFKSPLNSNTPHSVTLSLLSLFVLLLVFLPPVSHLFPSPRHSFLVLSVCPVPTTSLYISLSELLLSLVPILLYYSLFASLIPSHWLCLSLSPRQGYEHLEQLPQGLLASVWASSKDLKGNQTPYSLCFGFRGEWWDKTIITPCCSGAEFTSCNCLWSHGRHHGLGQEDNWTALLLAGMSRLELWQAGAWLEFF